MVTATPATRTLLPVIHNAVPYVRAFSATRKASDCARWGGGTASRVARGVGACHPLRNPTTVPAVDVTHQQQRWQHAQLQSGPSRPSRPQGRDGRDSPTASTPRPPSPAAAGAHTLKKRWCVDALSLLSWNGDARLDAGAPSPNGDTRRAGVTESAATEAGDALPLLDCTPAAVDRSAGGVSANGERRGGGAAIAGSVLFTGSTRQRLCGCVPATMTTTTTTAVAAAAR
jgi:hypothetical protein